MARIRTFPAELVEEITQYLSRDDVNSFALSRVLPAWYGDSILQQPARILIHASPRGRQLLAGQRKLVKQFLDLFAYSQYKNKVRLSFTSNPPWRQIQVFSIPDEAPLWVYHCYLRARNVTAITLADYYPAHGNGCICGSCVLYLINLNCIKASSTTGPSFRFFVDVESPQEVWVNSKSPTSVEMPLDLLISRSDYHELKVVSASITW